MNSSQPLTLSQLAKTMMRPEPKKDDKKKKKPKFKKSTSQVKKIQKPISAECQKIIDAISRVLGPESFAKLDKPILNYLANILSAQNNPYTKVPEQEIVDLLSLFFTETKVSSDGQQIVEKLLQQLKEEKLLKQVEEKKEQVEVLSEAVNLGKKFEESLKLDDEVLNRVMVNANEDLDWEQRMAKLKAEKKAKRSEKEKREAEKAYQLFLKQRGIQSSKGIIKLHDNDYKGGTRDIKLEGITITMGKSKLLENASLLLAHGRKYGLVGRNGVGKTTLLRHIEGRELEGIPPYLQILHIEQEVTPDDHTTALECVLKTDVERENLLREEKKILQNEEDSVCEYQL